MFYGLNPPDSEKPEKQKFEYVIIVVLNDDYGLDGIYELTWELFLRYKRWHKTMNAWNLSVTKKLIEDSRIIYKQTEDLVQ